MDNSSIIFNGGGQIDPTILSGSSRWWENGDDIFHLDGGWCQIVVHREMVVGGLSLSLFDMIGTHSMLMSWAS